MERVNSGSLFVRRFMFSVTKINFTTAPLRRGAMREMHALSPRNTARCQAASCWLLYSHIPSALCQHLIEEKVRLKASDGCCGTVRVINTLHQTLYMQHTSGVSSQSADNPPDTTNSTDLHNRAPVSRITLIPSSFICPIPCLLSGDMRQETKH